MSELFPDHPSSGTPESGKKGGLNAKIFGIPAWMAGLVAAAAVVVIVLYLRNRSASTSAASTTAAAPASSALAYDDPNAVDPNSPSGETYAEEGYTTTAAVDAYLAGDTSGAQGPVGLAPAGLPAPTTNVQWASLAADYLIGQGNDPTLVSNALNDYTDGNTLSAGEQAIVDIALQEFGEPPQGVQAVNTTAAPPTSAPSTSGTSSPASTTLTQPNVAGQTLEYGIPALEAAGWTINSTTTGGKTYAQSGYPTSQAQSKITATTYHSGSGQAGAFFANSVDVVASP